MKNKKLHLGLALCCAFSIFSGNVISSTANPIEKTPTNIEDLANLIKESNKKQEEFNKKIKTMQFKDEKIKRIFSDDIMKFFKDKMLRNKAELQTRADEQAKAKINRLKKISDDQKMIIDIKYKIKSLSEYYKFINKKLIPLETEILEGLQKMDLAIAPDQFQKQFDNVFKEEEETPVIEIEDAEEKEENKAEEKDKLEEEGEEGEEEIEKTIPEIISAGTISKKETKKLKKEQKKKEKKMKKSKKSKKNKKSKKEKKKKKSKKSKKDKSKKDKKEKKKNKK